ncbi:hypothetical protein BH10ACI1_BH10ACI1_29080 [soil metagenome]
MVSKFLMFNFIYKAIILVFSLNLFCVISIAQSKDKTFIQNLFADLRKDAILVAECEKQIREYQIANFGRVLPKISGHCWDGCPTNIVLPYYPKEAKRFNFGGQVKLETIVDETGKVVYAKAISGKPFLRQAAKQAAIFSRYQPKVTCDDKPIKFRWTITYNFILDK